MRLKLNGPVPTRNSPSSLAYHLDLLRDPTTDAARRLRIAVLYAIVFTAYGDPRHDPIAHLETEVLPQWRTTPTSTLPLPDDPMFRDIAAASTGVDLQPLVDSLKRVLRYATPAPPYQTPIQIRVQAGILEGTRNSLRTEGRLFKDVLRDEKKSYLPYLEVGPPQISPHTFYALNGTIRFDDLQCFDGAATLDECEMVYDVEGLRILPILLSLSDGAVQGHTSPGRTAGVHIPCGVTGTQRVSLHRNEPRRWFLYRYAFSLVAYLGIRVITELTPADLFVSVAHLHDRPEDDEAQDDNPRDDPEGFLAMLSKVLAQILGVDRLANAQGFWTGHATDRNARWIKRNMAASLYAPLPKRFHIQSPVSDVVPRLALVVVSSRESDGIKGDAQQRLATVYGEVSEIARVDAHTVRVWRRDSFSGTYPLTELFTRPAAITDRIHALYQEGFRHILYIAQAPYTSLLQAARPDTHEGLYFLSVPILAECLQAHPDLQIYPVFRDHYPAVKINALGSDTLYVQDTRELTRVVDDRSGRRQMAVFLNLFSGQTGVGQAGNAYRYHGVISYATLLNVYGDILDDQALREALIHHVPEGNPLKDTLVLYLTLFHLSRYEVGVRPAIALKLDPYSDIIGSGSVGAWAVRQHAQPGLRFNFLAFLTEVRNATTMPGRPHA